MKITDPYFLQAASAHSAGSKIVLRFSEADPTALGLFGAPVDVAVTATKNGVTTTTEYQGVQVVSAEADANTDIIMRGDFSNNSWQGVPGYIGEGLNRAYLDIKGTYGLGYLDTAGDVTIKNQAGCTFLMVGSAAETVDLSGFINVVYLDLVLPNATTIDLSHNTKITELRLYKCGFTSLDVSALSVLTNLEMFDTDNLQSVMLGNLPALDKLWAERCAVLTAPDVSGCPNLTFIYLRECGDINGLDLSHNPLLEGISFDGSAQLRTFDVSGNPALKNVSADLCVNLETIDLSHNPLADHVDVVNCRSLTLLDMSASTAIEFINYFGRDPETQEEYPVLPAIEVIKFGSIDSSGTCYAIINKTPVTDGTLYLNPNDSRYGSVKDLAEGKGWTVIDL